MTIAEAQMYRKAMFALKSTGLKLVQRGNENWLKAQQGGNVFSSPKRIVSAIDEWKTYNWNTTLKNESHLYMEDLMNVFNNLIQKKI